MNHMSPATGLSPEFLQKISAALYATGDVVYEWDLRNDAVVWQGAFENLFGLNPTDRGVTTGQGFHHHINIDDLPRRIVALEEHYTEGKDYDVEYRARHADGSFRWLHDRGSVEMGADGQPMIMRGILRSVHRRKQYEAQLEQRVNFDDLTGHFNRRRLRDRLSDALRQSQRYSYFGAFLVIGIDRMAMLNDAYGHEAADMVIIAIGQRLEAIIRNSDAMGRIDGDCYGIVLSRCPPEQMQLAAEKILRICRDEPIETEHGKIQVRVSVGGVSFPSLSQSAHDIITKAESALRHAKSRGRDCFVAYTQSTEQLDQHRRNMEIAHEVVEAIKEGRVMFAYQPVVDATTHKIEYYEALMRMKDKQGHLVPAMHFIPAVEQVGLTRLVDRFILELAIKDLEVNPDLSLAINISGLTVSEHSWLRVLIAALRERPEIAKRLIIEITETEALQDIEESARFVQAVRDLGCQVALDDFGAGYTSFKHLKSLTVDIVKIDGSFIRNIENNPENRTFVRSLLDLAKCFGLMTVAECIETEEQAILLRNEGVQHLQGYYFGKPEIGMPK